MARRQIAVIGSGVSGLTAAYVLQRVADVTLYEADGRLGGHAHTHELLDPDGTSLNVDSGFIVHNRQTYPNLTRLFDELGVETQESEMSMSIRCDGCGLQYAGARGLSGLFPTLRNVTNVRYLYLLTEVVRFHRRARRHLAAAGRRHDPRRVPGAGPLQPLLPVALRRADGRVRVVLRAGRGGCLPGALPVRVPRQPRHAVRARLAPVAHRQGWLGELCGEGRQAAVRGQPADAGQLRHPDGARRTGRRRGRRGGRLRRRRHRDPPGPGARDAGRADRGRVRRRSARGRTRRTGPPCTPTPRSCRRPRAPAPPGTTRCPTAKRPDRRSTSRTT